MQDYITYVENLARNSENQIFFNSGPNHAAIVMSRIFKYAQSEVKIFCGGFNGSVSNDEEYLKYLNDFLTRGGSVKILAEKDLSKGDSKIFKVLQKHNVAVYTTKAKMINSASGQPVHFAIGDNRMVRFENNIADYTAEVNFNDTVQAKSLSELFDQVYVKSQTNKISFA